MNLPSDVVADSLSQVMYSGNVRKDKTSSEKFTNLSQNYNKKIAI